jgi:TetR/AcrR family transcriptional regulator, transcriptional repressor for nem operon
MARPITFDETVALDAAIDCFWQRGYEATSVRDLAAAMGIAGTSLYNSFGSKRALFVQALERYLNRIVRPLFKRLQTSLPPKRAIGAFFAEVIDYSLSDRSRRGCLLVNAALEVAPHDRRLRAEIARRMDEVEAFFHCLITAAQRDGSIPRNVKARDTARLLLAVLLGIRVLARSKPDRALLEGIARPALALLDG